MPKLLLVAPLLLAALAGAARSRLEPEALAVGAVRDISWLPDGRAARAASLGQRLLLADLYWLKLVQYMGDMALRDGDWSALYPLADLTTDLDPRFGYAYQVAGSNLAGLAGRHSEAERILKKGIENVPDRWTIPWTLAVNKFLYEQDFAAAASYARQAAAVGRRPHLALLAANLSLVADQDDEYAAAEAVLLESIPQAEHPELRNQLEARLVRVRTYAVLSRLERAIAAFQARFARRPFTLDELAFQGLVRTIPPDPSGGVLRYDAATGRVRSSVAGERSPTRITIQP